MCFIGEKQSGKTTLINALRGKPAIPTFPTTCNVFYFRLPELKGNKRFPFGEVIFFFFYCFKKSFHTYSPPLNLFFKFLDIIHLISLSKG